MSKTMVLDSLQHCKKSPGWTDPEHRLIFTRAENTWSWNWTFEEAFSMDKDIHKIVYTAKKNKSVQLEGFKTRKDAVLYAQSFLTMLGITLKTSPLKAVNGSMYTFQNPFNQQTIRIQSVPQKGWLISKANADEKAFVYADYGAGKWSVYDNDVKLAPSLQKAIDYYIFCQKRV